MMGRKPSCIARMGNSVVFNGLKYRLLLWPAGSNSPGLLLLTLELVSNLFITLVPQVAGQ
jgi:hypothetical protein